MVNPVPNAQSSLELLPGQGSAEQHDTFQEKDRHEKGVEEVLVNTQTLEQTARLITSC